ncbi:MAG TPA: D-alanyl-D-alanine carboxypeptidase/D-alanyl-D-alanine-endopeptidase [Steroidobacteraceae bacterium]|nr:D-alanyl-D-alanine carboxypeptidase/D-alanyl-D-alanine-endopeptidase [Steroidobacteraceae bacterium]
MRRHLIPCLILLFAATGALGEPRRAPRVDRVIEAGHLPYGSVSFIVADVDSGAVILARNPATPRGPGSVMKLLTTFAALDTLGPAFTWRTRAFADAPIVRGVLRGNLYLKGGGDPYMTIERWWRFAAELRATGLKTIRGNVVIDDRAFSLPSEDPAAFDGHPNRPYNVIPDAMMVNFQSVDYRVAPNPAAHRVDVAAIPRPINLTIDDDVRLVGGRCAGAGDRVAYTVDSPLRDHVVFSGTMSLHCGPEVFTRAVMRAPQFAYGTFVQLWRELGGRVVGGYQDGGTPPGARVLVDFASMPLSEVVRLTDKFSNNVMARTIMLTLGERRYGAPATLDKGITVLEAWSHEHRIPLAGTVIVNGSGLSRKTRVSAETVAALLRVAYHSRYAPEFLASLPIAGVDGTLRREMTETVPGTVRLKTGHIDDVSAVAGYVRTRRGRTYVLVSFVNDPRVATGAAERVHRALVDWILAHG